MVIHLKKKKNKALALIDGEHYPPVIKEGLNELKRKEFDLVGAIFLGGTEKIGEKEDITDMLGLPVYTNSSKGIPYDSIQRACEDLNPDIALDLSDEPVVNYRKRFKIASELLKLNVDYKGADFSFKAPTFMEILEKPSISIIGTGKRVGKTSVSGYIARLVRDNGYYPTIVTMGRGGPKDPEIIDGSKIKLSPEYLLEMAESGKHAASDHWEDAITSRVTTIGCRRCGGGMAGQVFVSNVPKGAEIANEVDEKFVIMEGSGATMPPISTNRRIVIVGANQPMESIKGYFGRYRISISDLVILTMCEEPMTNKEKIKKINRYLLEIKPGLSFSNTVFRPKPLGDISNKKVFLAMTAPEKAIKSNIIPYLEKEKNCKVVGYSSNLSNRKLLTKDIEKNSKSSDLFLIEVKAAGIDVATKIALKKDKKVVYMDNIPKLINGNINNLKDEILVLTQKAIKNFNS